MSYEKVIGKRWLVAELGRRAIPYVFGNPGTTEQGFLAELGEVETPAYIMSLQEGVAVAMADGYARASGEIGVVNLHLGGGLANGLSQMYNAWQSRSRLLVTAGQSDSRLLVEKPLLSADLVTLASQFTKWAWELRAPEDLPTAFARAVKVASTPPTGPVFLSLPIDLLDGEFEVPVNGNGNQSRVTATTTTTEESFHTAARLLLEGSAPAILCGDGVGRAGAVDELVALADLLGADVYALSQTEVNFPNDHPLFVRTLNVNSSATRDVLAHYDRILAVGTPLFVQFLRTGDRPLISREIPVIQLDEDPAELGKNSPVALGLAGDLRPLCAGVVRELVRTASALQKERVREQALSAATRKQQRRRRLDERQATSLSGDGSIDPLTFMVELHRAVTSRPPWIIIDEASTNSAPLHQVFQFSQPGTLFGARGGALGWGLPAAVGVQLARPGELVVAVVGDGASMFSIQALWSAAHYGLPVKFIVCNNGEYGILKRNMRNYLSGAEPRHYVGMDLADPAIDFAKLARGLGLWATRLSSRSELNGGLQEFLDADGPSLLDVRLARAV